MQFAQLQAGPFPEFPWGEDFGAPHETYLAEQVDRPVFVYHYPTQKWNDLPLADIPYDLEALLETRRARRTSRDAALAAAAAGDLDDEETLIMHDALLQELAKPIPAGQRNNTLFAIGSKLKAAGVPDWDKYISSRADELGLDWEEGGKIIRNIDAYA